MKILKDILSIEDTMFFLKRVLLQLILLILIILALVCSFMPLWTLGVYITYFLINGWMVLKAGIEDKEINPTDLCLLQLSQSKYYLEDFNSGALQYNLSYLQTVPSDVLDNYLISNERPMLKGG
jgi:hypothetical protein